MCKYNYLALDLGTDSTRAAQKRNGKLKIIPLGEVSQAIPTLISYDGEEIHIGESAKKRRLLHPENTLALKNLIGSSQALLAGRNFSVEELLIHFLKEIKNRAETFLGESINGAVISIPDVFLENQRQVVKNAATRAGFRWTRLLSETNAAVLAMNDTFGIKEEILALNLGAGSFSASILETESDVTEMIVSNTDFGLGGETIDRKVVEWIRREFVKTTGKNLEEDPITSGRLREAAERAKTELSSVSSTEIHLVAIYQDETGTYDLNLILTRVTFDHLIRNVLTGLKKLITATLKDAKDSKHDIDIVLLSGGCSHIPAVAELVEKYFKKARIIHFNNPENVVRGLCALGGILTGDKSSKVLSLTTEPNAIGVICADGSFKKLIDYNTTVPTRVEEIFTTDADRQDRVKVIFVEKKRYPFPEETVLDDQIISNIKPGKRGRAKIRVIVDIDATGNIVTEAEYVGDGSYDYKTPRLRAD